MIRRAILATAAFMGITTCYAVTIAALAICTAVVAIFGESGPAAVGIIYALSASSIVQASTILVAQRHGEQEARRRDEAMHAKLDSLLSGVDKADDRLPIPTALRGEPLRLYSLQRGLEDRRLWFDDFK